MSLNLIDKDSVAQATITSGKRGFSVEDISEQTTLSKAYLRNKIRDGSLKATRFGRRIVVLSEDLEVFLKNGSE